MGKPVLRCNKCSAIYHYQVKRDWIFRYILFFLPVKTYFCAKCAKRRNVWINDKKAAEYEPV
jgi:hypothetical protein